MHFADAAGDDVVNMEDSDIETVEVEQESGAGQLRKPRPEPRYYSDEDEVGSNQDYRLRLTHSCTG